MNYYDYNYGYDYGTTATSAGLGALFTTIFLIALIPSILQIIGMWKMFTKAGKPGWAAIIPYYNNYVLFEIGGQPGAYIFFSFIPFVGAIIYFVFYIKAVLQIAQKFGKSTGFGVLSIFFPFITFLILGFSNCTYEGQATENQSSILDVNEEGVPNSSDESSFNYGYEKEETISMEPVDENKNDNSNNE